MKSLISPSLKSLAIGATAAAVLAGVGLATPHSASAATLSIDDSTDDIVLYYSGFEDIETHIGIDNLEFADFHGEYKTLDPNWGPGTVVTKKYNIYGPKGLEDGIPEGSPSDTLIFTSTWQDNGGGDGPNLSLDVAFRSGYYIGIDPEPFPDGETLYEQTSFS